MKKHLISSLISSISATFFMAISILNVNAQKAQHSEIMYPLSAPNAVEVFVQHVETATTVTGYPEDTLTLFTGTFALGGGVGYSNASNQTRPFINIGIRDTVPPIAGLTSLSYVTNTEYLSKTVKSTRSYNAFDIKVLDGNLGYIVCGEVNDTDSLPAKRAFLMRTDKFGNVVWFRQYYPTKGNADQMSFQSVAFLGAAQGYVAVGYRYDKVKNRKIARLVKMDFLGNVLTTKELVPTSANDASDYSDVILYSPTQIVTVGSSQVTYNSAQTKISSDVLVSVYNPSTNAIASIAYRSPSALVSDGYVEEGRALVKHGTKVSVVGKRYLANITNPTSAATFANQSIFLMSLNISGTTTSLNTAWTKNPLNIDIANSVTENPKDIIYNDVAKNGTAAGLWIVGLYNEKAFLLNVNASTGVPNQNAEIYTNSQNDLTGEGLTMGRKGQISFVGRSEYGGQETMDMVTRKNGTAIGYCQASFVANSYSKQNISTKTHTSIVPASISISETHVAVNNNAGVENPCGTSARVANENASNEIQNTLAITDNQVVVYPNPFQKELNFKFSLQANETISLEIFNANGQLLEKIVKDATFNSGEHLLNWTPNALPNGLYVWKLTSSNASINGKILKID